MKQQADYGIDGPAAVVGFVVAGGLCLAAAAAMLWSSKIGKLRARDELIGAIPWRGDEQVLDVGCGRGLLLIAAAKRLTSGKAIGSASNSFRPFLNPASVFKKLSNMKGTSSTTGSSAP